jgi:glycine cleavage system aminomethyltransferase T
LADDRFWVITPAFAQYKTLGQLNRLARGRNATVFDATAGYATIGVMGPNSRELMSRVSPNDWSNDAQRYTHTREVEVADGHALCLRVSFVGELGYELYPASDQAVNVYDALVEAGKDLGLRRAGYLALDSLRTEKGYRHLGHDIGPYEDPFEAGLGFTVSMKKSTAFIGREALEKRADTPPTRRTVFVALRDPRANLVHDESIVLDGQVVGRLTSSSYGFTIGRACGVGHVAVDTPLDATFLVDCGGTEYEADLSERPFYDPDNSRLLA